MSSIVPIAFFIFLAISNHLWSKKWETPLYWSSPPWSADNSNLSNFLLPHFPSFLTTNPVIRVDNIFHVVLCPRKNAIYLHLFLTFSSPCPTNACAHTHTRTRVSNTSSEAWPLSPARRNQPRVLPRHCLQMPLHSFPVFSLAFLTMCIAVVLFFPEPCSLPNIDGVSI